MKLALLVFWLLTVVGCHESWKETATKKALKACASAGLDDWSLHGSYLEVQCKDGTRMRVEYLP